MTARPRLGLGIRAQLLLVLTVFLAIPWLGYRYVQELERFLREGQERTLAGTAQAVATALHDRPALFARREGPGAALAQARADGTGGPAASRPAGDDVPAGAPEVEQILQGLTRTTARIFVVDRQANVLARAGSLRAAEAPPPEAPTGLARAWAVIERYTLHPLYTALLRQPTEEFSDDFLGGPLPFAKEVDGALAGILTTARRASSDGRVTIVAAAHPVWVGDAVQGAVVVEETINPVLVARNRAFERLFTLVLGVLLLGTLAVTAYATRLSSRIRGLRDEVERAIDARGRVQPIVAGSRSRDEIGDLSRSFSDVLARLAEAASHREALASRLSHELRTPIAVVRSSLENLRSAPPAEARVYLDRAQGGLDRLAQILTRMSEASRLEQSLRDAEREDFDLAGLVRACVAGYRDAYPQTGFVVEAADDALPLAGAPDLVAQMLDKLVANAVEFGAPGTPVTVAVGRSGSEAQLAVTNDGPRLPAAMRDRLFESMVSVRAESHRGDAAPHLGLGLYIVRLIAEGHGGRVGAVDRPDGRGVTVTVTLPLRAGG